MTLEGRVNHRYSDTVLGRWCEEDKGQHHIILLNFDELCLGALHTKFQFDWLICLKTIAKSLGVQKRDKAHLALLSFEIFTIPLLQIGLPLLYHSSENGEKGKCH